VSIIVYADGVFVGDPAQAKVSLFDRGYLLGDGIFETIRLTGGRAVRLDAHLDRLWFGASVTGLVPREDRSQIAQLAQQIATHVASIEEVSLRVTISRGEGPRGIGIEGYDRPLLTIIAQPFPTWPRTLDVSLVVPPRMPPFDPRFKTASNMGTIIARRTITTREGLQTALDGQLVCGLVSNILLVHGNTLSTPHLDSGCLPGVTRAAALTAAPWLGLAPVERRVEVEDLWTADEVMLSSALMGVVAVSSIDGREVRMGPWAQRLDRSVA